MLSSEFKSKLEGYTKLTNRSMLLTLPLGSWIRYKIQKKGEHIQYRLGGALMYVDPELRFIKLKNFLMDPRSGQNSWSAQVNSGTTFYYKLTPNGLKQVELRKAAGISDEQLLKMLETGDVAKLVASSSSSLPKVNKLK